jgi:hypothetical protein
MVGQGTVPAMIGLEYNRSKHKRYWLTTQGRRKVASEVLRRPETSDIRGSVAYLRFAVGALAG